MYDKNQLSLQIQSEEIILKNKKIILGCLFEIQIYEELLTEAMDDLAKVDPEDDKAYARAGKKVETMDKKLDASKLKMRVAEKTIELA